MKARAGLYTRVSTAMQKERPAQDMHAGFSAQNTDRLEFQLRYIGQRCIQGVVMFVVLPSDSPLKRELRAQSPHEKFIYNGDR